MSDDAQAYIHLVDIITSETYCTFAAFTLLSFEWIITFDREVRLVWGRKVTGATILFIMNRYWLFLLYITQVITTYPISKLQCRCDIDAYMVLVGKGGPIFIWAFFSTLRAYAVSGRRWWVIPLVFCFYIPSIVTNCIYFSHLKPKILPPPFNCVLASSLPEGRWVQFVLADRICQIAGDLVVLLITWYSTFGIKRAAAGLKLHTSLTDALLKNGTLYFVCLLILNMVNIFANVFPKTSEVSSFQDPITSILVSRFLLNLRDTGYGNHHSPTDLETDPSFVARSQAPTTTTLTFANFVDPMGADLDHGVLSRRRSPTSSDWLDEGEGERNEEPCVNEMQSLTTKSNTWIPGRKASDGMTIVSGDEDSVEAKAQEELTAAAGSSACPSLVEVSSSDGELGYVGIQLSSDVARAV